jgi:hypothetical protein
MSPFFPGTIKRFTIKGRLLQLTQSNILNRVRSPANKHGQLQWNKHNQIYALEEIDIS